MEGTHGLPAYRSPVMSTRVWKAVRDSKSTEESSAQRQLWLRNSMTPSIPQQLAFMLMPHEAGPVLGICDPWLPCRFQAHVTANAARCNFTFRTTSDHGPSTPYALTNAAMPSRRLSQLAVKMDFGQSFFRVYQRAGCTSNLLQSTVQMGTIQTSRSKEPCPAWPCL